MRIEDKIGLVTTNLAQLENPDRKMNARQRRRAAYWLRCLNRLEWRSQREFRCEMWRSIFNAVAEGKIKSVHIMSA